MTISWYPGHMAKSKRLLLEQLKRVHAVIEICDARIPLSSRNPQLKALAEHKPHILLMNKADLASPGDTKKWLKYFATMGETAIALEANKAGGVKQVVPAIKKATQEQVARAQLRGLKKTVRVMIVGVPNVGKSTLINSLAGRSPLKTEDRPGVTRSNQWVKIDAYLELMDSPGLLWPRLDSQVAAKRLAYIAAIRDEVLNTYELCISLLDDLMEPAPGAVGDRYKVADAGLRGAALLESICRGRGFLLPGAQPDIDRAVATVLNEFRDGRIARITLEKAPDAEDKHDVQKDG